MQPGAKPRALEAADQQRRAFDRMLRFRTMAPEELTRRGAEALLELEGPRSPMRRRVPTASLLAATALLLWAPACSTRAAGQPDGGVANQPDGGKASQPDGGEAGQPDGGEEICEGGPDAACACNDLPCPGVTYV